MRRVVQTALAACLAFAACANPMSGVQFACDPDGPDTCVSGWVCVRAEAGHKYKGVCTPAGDGDVAADPGPADPGVTDEGTVPDDPGPVDPGADDPAGPDSEGETDGADAAGDLAEPTPDLPESLPDVPDVGPDTPDVCVPSWSCSGWSICTCGNTQTQTCTDTKACPTTTGKPAESQSCDPCGNGTCDCGETNATCAKDCSGPVCEAAACPVVPGWTVSCNEKAACKYTGGPGAEMVYVPGGPFRMGRNKDGAQCPTNTLDTLDPFGDGRDLPCHEVTVPGFLLDKYETTVAAYKTYYDANGGASSCKNPGDGAACTPSTGSYCNWGVGGKEQHPVNCVTWYQMDGYCKGIGKRLCFEAEWEKAARGTDGRLYPWGDQAATCDYAVMFDGSKYGCGTDSTWEVGLKTAGASPYGAMDMAGNVWEWVEDDWHGNYTGAPTGGKAWVDDPRASNRVGRGGSFVSVAVYLRGSYRYVVAVPSGDGDGLGSRCCRSP